MGSTTLILFDLDGTIVDTETCAMDVVGMYFSRHGFTVPTVDLEYLIGRSWAMSLEFLLGRYPLEKPLVIVEQELLSEYREVLQTEGWRLVRFFAAIKMFLRSQNDVEA